MKLLVDTHTHTVASGHAYSTLRENALLAAQKGLEAFCCTDHGPGLAGSAPDYILSVLQGVPDTLEGVRMIRGCELNIKTYDGGVDLSHKYIEKTEFLIASMHEVVIAPGTEEQNTAALVGALQNPYVDAVGHPGNPHYPVHIEEVVDLSLIHICLSMSRMTLPHRLFRIVLLEQIFRAFKIMRGETYHK